MSLISFKKIKENEYFLNGNPYFLVGILIFIISFGITLFSTDVISALIISIGITFIAVVGVIINDIIGKKKHKSIINSKVFKNLISLGYKVEKFGEYRGLLGTKNNRDIRIYYDWNKLAKGFLSFGDLIVCIYYEPLIINGNDANVKVDTIDELRKVNNVNRDYTTKKFFGVDRVTLHINYHYWTKYSKIISEIETTIAQLNSLDLKPVNKLAEHNINFENQNFFLPHFELIWDYTKNEE